MIDQDDDAPLVCGGQGRTDNELWDAGAAVSMFLLLAALCVLAIEWHYRG